MVHWPASMREYLQTNALWRSFHAGVDIATAAQSAKPNSPAWRALPERTAGRPERVGLPRAGGVGSRLQPVAGTFSAARVTACLTFSTAL
jgi:hypothetical protein